MIGAFAEVAKDAVVETAEETAASSAMNDVALEMKDVASKGQDLAAERLSKLETEVMQSCPEDYKSNDVAEERLSKLEEKVRNASPEDYETRDIAEERLVQLEKKVEQASAEEIQDGDKRSVEQKNEMSRVDNKDAMDAESPKQDVSDKGIGGFSDEIKKGDINENGDNAKCGMDDTKTAQEGVENRRNGLTDEEKLKIKEETGWSDEIVDAIDSWDEYRIYKEANLVNTEIGGKECLSRNDIDWKQKDTMGRTNKERVEQGLSPINKDGKGIELHHIGQHPDSPLAELTPEEHRGQGNDSILHDKNKKSEIDRQAFARERNAHWQERAKESEVSK